MQSLEQQQQVQQQQQSGGVPAQPVVSPRTPSYPTNPTLPHHKPFMTSTKPGPVGVMNPPISPNLQPQQPVHNMASPLTPGAPPHLVHPQGMSPKNIAPVNRVPPDHVSYL